MKLETAVVTEIYAARTGSIAKFACRGSFIEASLKYYSTVKTGSWPSTPYIICALTYDIVPSTVAGSIKQSHG